MAGVLKKTTGLVGLAVCDSPHERLRILYAKILDVLEQIPKNAAYRKYTEQITNEKLDMVKAESDVKRLEDRLQGGHIEEVILQSLKSGVYFILGASLNLNELHFKCSLYSHI
ncbi:NADH dehydrogenase [ubiquinone] 1 alpha subcomplex subunit 5 isoform 2-T2 [Hipposideros larvatus]